MVFVSGVFLCGFVSLYPVHFTLMVADFLDGLKHILQNLLSVSVRI